MSGSDTPADDPWGFLPKREGNVPVVENVEKRARGELRGEMSSVSLKQRAWPIALSLALVALSGMLTEIVATSHLLTVAGPKSLSIVFPLGGLGLIAVAALQFRFIDQSARLPLLRSVTVGYGLIFALAIVLVLSSVLETAATTAVVLLGDQLNFLLPLIIWSLAGDEFNVAEARKIFGWIVSWTYGGQVLGLLATVISPGILEHFDVDLTVVLCIVPVVTIFIGLWLPRSLKNSAAATGLHKAESSSESLKSAWDFIQGVPVWKKFLLSSVLTFVAGMTSFLAYFGGADRLLGSDSGSLQMHLGGVTFVSFALCWIIQKVASERIQDKIGIPGALIILPLAAILAAGLISIGIATDSVWFILVGISIWLVPRWSIDENARRAALSLVPDERRARVSFIVDLGPVAIGLVVAAPLSAIGFITGKHWLVPIIALVFAIAALVPAWKVRQGWEESLLNWRLRRRKQNKVLDF
jgi:hypothetical protein